MARWGPKPKLLLAIRKAIAEKPDEYRALVAKLKKNGLQISANDRLKRTPGGFVIVTDADLVEAIRNRHFAVRMEIDPDSITEAALADRLVDFVERARPLVDWIRKIEGTLPPDQPD